LSKYIYDKSENETGYPVELKNPLSKLTTGGGEAQFEMDF
jgi:hypothetical protein